MIVTGKIIVEGDGVPGSVYISDASGKIIMPTIGTSADVNGNYSLNVPGVSYADPNAYITAQFVGAGKQTKTLMSNVNFNLQSTGDLAEVEVTANKITKPKIWPWLLAFTIIGTTIGVMYKKKLIFQ